MILRRNVEALKQLHWIGVFIELVIFILGVYIGLQAQDWNQAGRTVSGNGRISRGLPANSRSCGWRLHRLIKL